MKILYGVVGEGMGHAMRSRVVIEHLVRGDHDVVIMASQRAADYLGRRFADVNKIHGFHIVTEQNEVQLGKTLVSNLARGAAALPRQMRAYVELVQEFRPDAVISDFESWTYAYAKAHRVPIFSLDNIQMINRCVHDADVLQGARPSFELARAIVKGKLPFCDHYFITSFFYPPLRKEKTSLHPSVLRDEVLGAAREPGEHLLVYQTAEGHDALAAVLARAGVECRVYGMRRGITEEQVEGTLRYRPFDEQTFITDLASARAVVSGGGFTLMSEAVYLHKPVLAVPIEGQFEQVMNARYLERLEYGMAAEHIDDATLGRFLDALPRLEASVSRYEQDGNKDLFDALDAALDRALAGVYG